MGCSCKVLYDSIKIGGYIKVVPIHVGPRRSAQTFLCDQAWLGSAFTRLGCLLQSLWV